MTRHVNDKWQRFENIENRNDTVATVDTDQFGQEIEVSIDCSENSSPG